MAGGELFEIQHVFEPRLEDVHEFFSSRLTEHLFPRTLEDFRRLADEEALYVLARADQEQTLVGLSYVMEGEEPVTKVPRYEYGGVIIDHGCRDRGFGSTLGRVVSATHAAYDLYGNDYRLISHVHEDNTLPPGMLTRQLGFDETPPPERIPQHHAPPGMKTNQQGEVVGVVFVLNRTRLAGLADWVERFDGTASGKEGTFQVRVSVPSFSSARRQGVVTALRELSAKAP